MAGYLPQSQVSGGWGTAGRGGGADLLSAILDMISQGSQGSQGTIPSPIPHVGTKGPGSHFYPTGPGSTAARIQDAMDLKALEDQESRAWDAQIRAIQDKAAFHHNEARKARVQRGVGSGALGDVPRHIDLTGGSIPNYHGRSEWNQSDPMWKSPYSMWQF